MNTPSNQSEREQALPNILDKYHIVKYENLGKSETDWYELATELEALIESQRTEAQKELLREISGATLGSQDTDLINDTVMVNRLVAILQKKKEELE